MAHEQSDKSDIYLALGLSLSALEIRHKLDQRWRLALTLNRLGGVAYRRQEYTEAKSDYQESLAILLDFGEKLHLSSTLARYGEVCAALWEYDQAKEAYLDSLRLAQQAGATGTTLRALLGIAELLAKQGDGGLSFEILSAIAEHPALEKEDRDRAERLLAAIEAPQSLPVVRLVHESGWTTVLEKQVRNILRSDL